MERLRKPFQGVTNIIRFNWPFYVFAILLIISSFLAYTHLNTPYATYLLVGTSLALAGTVSSLLVSFYIYDRSDLYRFSWLDNIDLGDPKNIVTVNAGFDETSALLQQRFPAARLHVFDFYNPALHTEASIKRARATYPAYPGTLPATTSAVPMASQTVDVIFLILAAHEIRQAEERTQFFTDLRRTLKPGGTLLVVEHLRDVANFLAYTIGFLHFLSKATWVRTFQRAKLIQYQTFHITPFITVFILKNNDLTP